MTATQEEAAVAYDIAAIEHRGLNAVTNFDISHYVNWHQRRRRRLAEDNLDATETIPIQLPTDLTEHDHAAFQDGEHHQHQYHIADSYIVQQLPVPDDDKVMKTLVHDAPPSSALDLLLQSPKVKEIMEQMSAPETTTATESSTSSLSSCTSSSSPSLSQSSSTELQPESSVSAPSAPPCIFPDDVQTSLFNFECDDGMSFALAEVDTFLFGDLGSYAAPMFQCDVDVFV